MKSSNILFSYEDEELLAFFHIYISVPLMITKDISDKNKIKNDVNNTINNNQNLDNDWNE